MISTYPRQPGAPPPTLEDIARWQREMLGSEYLDLVAGAAAATSRYYDDDLEEYAAGRECPLPEED